MKNNTLTFIISKIKMIIILLILNNYSVLIAQDFTELPMKDSMVYYSFDHSLSNSRNCLSNYYTTDFYISLARKLTEITSQNNADKTILQDGHYIISLTQGKRYSNNSFGKLNCSDTVVSRYNTIVIPIEKSIRQYVGPVTLPGQLVEFYKSKLASQKILFTVQTIFKDKNNYTLIYKGFVLQNSYLKKTTLIQEEIKLEDAYNQIKNKEKKTKNEIRFYNQINSLLLSIDKLYEEAITEEYKTDDGKNCT